tara:strand:- start:76 stop:528 length:453 start_codon:yes stop_codon:yes gene_type:complete
MRSDVLNSSSNKFGQVAETYDFQAKTAGFTAAAGDCYLVTDLDGCAVVLPAPVVGDKIKIVFGAVTSNNHTITCDATTTLFSGYALMLDADGTAAQCKVFAPDESDDDVITLNGGTTGISGTVELLAISDKMWQVEAILYSEGTVATPFA